MGKILLILGVVCVIVGTAKAGFSEQCPQISGNDAQKIASYVHDQFRFANETTLEVSKVEAVKDTCFKKVYLRQKGSAGRTDFVFFLSPDNRFLSRDLFDIMAPASPIESSVRINNMRELLDGRFPSKGASKAPVTIVIFADFECPYCSQTAKILNKEMALDPSKLRLIFRHLPLPMHPWAKVAAEMTECAFAQSNEAFWGLHDFLFANQSELNLGNLETRVGEFLSNRPDINRNSFASCVAEHKMAPEIERDLLFAQQHRINGTPTLFVNGIRKQGLSNIQDLRHLLDYRLPERTTAAPVGRLAGQ